jgi:hypothetical protein
MTHNNPAHVVIINSRRAGIAISWSENHPVPTDPDKLNTR